jgi:predicted transcriptional regulator
MTKPTRIPVSIQSVEKGWRSRDMGARVNLPVVAERRYSSRMEVHVTAETAKRLNDLATTSGRAPEDIVEDALAGYLEEVTSVRKTLDSRHDELKTGRVKPIDGEEAFRKLREKSERRRSDG